MCPILGPLVPLCWVSGDISSGFESHSGFCFICLFCGGECNIHSLRSTSGATPADLLTTSIAASHFPTCINQQGPKIGHVSAKNINLKKLKSF